LEKGGYKKKAERCITSKVQIVSRIKIERTMKKQNLGKEEKQAIIIFQREILGKFIEG